MQFRAVGICLLVLVVALMLVGVVSSTVVRHIIQASPAIVALVCVSRRVSWSQFAALPLYIVWLLLMSLIWAFLLGWSRIVTGRFTPAEIALTLVIGASCVAGIAFAARWPPAGSRIAAAVAFVGFAALQVAAIWLSVQPQFARI